MRPFEGAACNWTNRDTLPRFPQLHTLPALHPQTHSVEQGQVLGVVKDCLTTGGFCGATCKDCLLVATTQTLRAGFGFTTHTSPAFIHGIAYNRLKVHISARMAYFPKSFLIASMSDGAC